MKKQISPLTRDQRALKYWREKGYDQQAIASLTECFQYIDQLIELCDDRACELIADIEQNLFRINKKDS